MALKTGRIILLNGTSSAGKSALAQGLREVMAEPFCYFASDQLAEAGFRAFKDKVRGAGAWDERARFFDGFHRSIAAFAAAGNDMIVEHIVEEASWAEQLKELLAPYDVFWVGVHAPMAELERRERERGDRSIGEAKFHLKTHEHCAYNVEVDTSEPIGVVVEKILNAWQSRGASAR